MEYLRQDREEEEEGGGMVAYVGGGYYPGGGGLPACLPHVGYKVVVASWAAVVPPDCPTPPEGTSSFYVDLATYAPRQTKVTRAILVDVDIPHTQLLVEDAWARMYFAMGVLVSPTCRSLALQVGGVELASVRLPLPVDTLRGYEFLPDGWLRLYWTQPAPEPVTELVRCWAGFGGSWAIVGLPGLAGPVDLLAGITPVRASVGGGPCCFEIFPPPGVVSVVGTPPLVLACASCPPTPTILAKVLTRCLAADAPAGIRPEVRYWSGPDVCEVVVRRGGGGGGAGPLPPVLLSGSLTPSMGFGSAATVLEEAAGASGVLAVRRPRWKGGSSFGGPFARVDPGDAASQADLADRLQAAFNAFIWPASWVVELAFPGDTVPSRVVPVPGGCLTLDGVAAAVSAAMASALAGAGVPTPVCSFGAPAGRFTWAAASPFSVRVVDPEVARRLGGFLPDQWYGPATRVSSPKPCPGQPLLPVGNGDQYRLPPARVLASVASNGALTLLPQPLPAVPVVSVGLAPPPAAGGSRVLAALPPGLWPGDVAALTTTLLDGTYVCANVVVYAAPNPVEVGVQPLTAADAAGLAALAAANPLPPSTALVPLLPPCGQPLALFMQRAPVLTAAAAQDWAAWANTVTGDTWGFTAPWTYTNGPACAALTSPGTLETAQDSHLLVCLGFTGGDAPPVAGKVYYPFPRDGHPLAAAGIIFAKVNRSSCFLRCEFDRLYDCVWPGEGTTLTTVRVAILNNNGTPYQTHGHDVSLTLRLEGHGTEVGWGGPYLPAAAPPG